MRFLLALADFGHTRWDHTVKHREMLGAKIEKALTEEAPMVKLTNKRVVLV